MKEFTEYIVFVLMTVVLWSRVPSCNIIVGFYTLEASKERCATCWTSTSLLTLAQEHKNIECGVHDFTSITDVCVCRCESVGVYVCVLGRLAIGPIECC